MPTGVRGVALLNRKIFAVLHEDPDVRVLDVDGLLSNDPIHVVDEDQNKALQWPSDIVADPRRAFVYISDRRSKYVGSTGCPGLFVLKPFAKGGPVARYFSLDGATPAGMSMTANKHLLVACEHAGSSGRSLRQYVIDDNGNLTADRVIDLAMMSKYLLQPVMLDEKLFAVSQIRKSSNLHRVCLIDETGTEKARSFGGSMRSAWPSIRSPWGVVVDPLNCRRLLVANCHEHKMVLLDDKLNLLRDLVSRESCGDVEFLCPRCMCYDAESGLLYVGRRWKGEVGRRDSAVKGAITVFRVAPVSGGVTSDEALSVGDDESTNDECDRCPEINAALTQSERETSSRSVAQIFQNDFTASDAGRSIECSTISSSLVHSSDDVAVTQ